MTGRVLYMLATPIGNLEDISARARRLLQTAACVAAEDTRVARRLFAALALPPPPRLLSLRAHNEAGMAKTLLAALPAAAADAHVVYLADAGTPAISDPGARLARAARAAGWRVSPAPGACAFAALLSVAGAREEGGAHFYGFPPVAAARRRAFFASLRQHGGCVLLYESPRRVAQTLAELAAELGGGCRAVLGRELTKKHEQIVDATLAELAQKMEAGQIPARGEFALLVEPPKTAAKALDAGQLFAALAAELPPRRAAALAARLAGGDAAALYRAHTRRQK